MRRGYYFQTYKYRYLHRVKTTKMILVAETAIFWVSTMNKLYCTFIIIFFSKISNEKITVRLMGRQVRYVHFMTKNS
jgi:hypothetical protein